MYCPCALMEAARLEAVSLAVPARYSVPSTGDAATAVHSILTFGYCADSRMSLSPTVPAFAVILSLEVEPAVRNSGANARNSSNVAHLAAID